MDDDICKALTDLYIEADLLKRHNTFTMRCCKLESAIIHDLWALHICILILIDLEVKRLVDELDLLL